MSVSDRKENIVGKGENADYQHFLLFPQCFQKAFSSGSGNPGIVWERVKSIFSAVFQLYPASHFTYPCSQKSFFNNTI